MFWAEAKERRKDGGKGERERVHSEVTRVLSPEKFQGRGGDVVFWVRL